MPTTAFPTITPADSGLFSPAPAPPRWRPQTEPAQLERILTAAILSTLTDTTPPVTLASAQRPDGYTALALTGTLNTHTIRTLNAHLQGLLNGGTTHLILDLSQVEQLNPRLPTLLHHLEHHMTTRHGTLELTGLTPHLLHDMHDDPLARVFTLYRTAQHHAEPHNLSWAHIRCPQGLDDVAEPHTTARHRTIIDTRSADTIPPRWTPRPTVPAPRPSAYP